MNKYVARASYWSIIGGGSILMLIASYYVVNAVGRLVAPQVEHHEQEQAHCYTAGKLFFVSISCVPKS